MRVVELFWFLFGLGVGLLLDFFLVLHMLKPIKRQINKLENSLPRYVKLESYNNKSKGD